MSGVPPGWDNTASSCGVALASMRANITVGAASVDEQGLDTATTILHQNPGAFARFRSSIEGGAGTAVDNVNELYALGLPAGLPGGLAALAMEHRPELVQRVERLADKRTKMQSMRSSSAEGSGQLKGRKRGVYDGPQEERCYDCQEDEGEAEGNAEGGGEAGGGGGQGTGGAGGAGGGEGGGGEEAGGEGAGGERGRGEEAGGAGDGAEGGGAEEGAVAVEEPRVAASTGTAQVGSSSGGASGIHYAPHGSRVATSPQVRRCLREHAPLPHGTLTRTRTPTPTRAHPFLAPSAGGRIRDRGHGLHRLALQAWRDQRGRTARGWRL